MAANADRVAIVQSLVAAGARAAHQEQPITVAQDYIRNDLLPIRICFRIGSRPKAAVRSDGGKVIVEGALCHAAPAKAARNVGPGEA